MREFTYTSHLSFELPLEEGRQEKGKHYKPVYLAGAAPLSLDNNNSCQPQLASAYAFGCCAEHFAWIIEISIYSPEPSLCFTEEEMETSRGVCQGHATVTGRGREHRLLISVFNNRLCRHKISWQARTENQSVVSTHSRKRILHKRNTFVISKSASVNYPSESRVVMEFTLCGACSLGFDKCSMACCLPSYNCTK